LGLYLFIPMGASGAAWAVALGGAISYLAMGFMAWRTLQRLERHEIEVVDEERGSTAE